MRGGGLVILYAWLLFALSLFEATHGYSEKLTGFILSPISALATRIGGALPVAIIVAEFGGFRCLGLQLGRHCFLRLLRFGGNESNSFGL